MRPCRQLHALPARRAVPSTGSTLGHARLVGVLRAAARSCPHAHAHVRRVDPEHPGCDRQHVEQAPARELGVHPTRGGVLGDLEPATRGLGALVELDGDGVVGQVGVIDAVAGHVLATRPLGAEARHLREPAGKLVGGGHEHARAPAARKLNRGRRCHRVALLVDTDGRRVAPDDDLGHGRGLGAQGRVRRLVTGENDEPSPRMRRELGEHGGLRREGGLPDPRQVRRSKTTRGEHLLTPLRLQGDPGAAQGLATGRERARPAIQHEQRAGVLLARGRARLRLGEKRPPGVRVMPRPAGEAPARAQQTRCAVQRDARSLHEHAPLPRPERRERGRAGADSLVPPAGGEQRGGVVGPQRAQARVAARGVAASEERLAGEVDRQRGTLGGETDGHGHVRARRVHHRSRAAHGDQTVHDGVLGA